MALLGIAILSGAYALTLAVGAVSCTLPAAVSVGAAVFSGLTWPGTSTTTEHYTARFVVNAAGCAADKISAMAGAPDFEIKPRWGDYLLLHKDQGKHCRHVLFPAPGPMGKGIVAQPTLWGNLLLGPTARDVHNPEHMARTSTQIIHELIVKCRELIGGFDAGKVIHAFAGMRAKNSRNDWIIEECPTVPRLIQVRSSYGSRRC